MESLAGQFLMSMPKLRGGPFGDSLIYLWSHDKDGAQGLLINRPHELTLVKLLHQLDLPSPLHAATRVADGGPVDPQRGFILHSQEAQVDSSEDAGAGLVISFSREILEMIASGQGPQRYLVALGYAGWGPGQLEDELAYSDWLTAPSCLDVIFELPFEERLDRVAGDMGIDLRLLSTDAGYA